MHEELIKNIRSIKQRLGTGVITTLNGTDHHLMNQLYRMEELVNKNFALADVRKSLPSQEEINEQIDKYAFRVPYDGSNNFYDEVALKHYKAGIEWLLGRIRGNGA